MDTRINVLEVVGNAIVGGMENYLRRLVQRLPPERFAVTCLLPFESQIAASLRASGGDVMIAPMPPENPSWRSIQLACALVNTRSIDVIHAHMSNAHTLAGLAGSLCGKPVLATIHGREVTMGDLEVHRTTGSHLMVVSRHTYFQALAIGVSSTQLHVIPNGVDTQQFHPHGPHDVLQTELGLASGTPLVGFVGRLAPEKGPERFVRAAWLIGQACPEVHFVMIGTGALLERVTELRAALGMERRIHLCGARDDLHRLYPSLALLMLTSHTEAMPLALLEAMACGVPVAATAVGGVPEVVQHELTGLLAEESDLDALACYAQRMLGDRQRREAMGRKARERAVDAFSITHSTAALHDLFARLSARADRASERRMSAVSGVVKPPHASDSSS